MRRVTEVSISVMGSRYSDTCDEWEETIETDVSKDSSSPSSWTGCKAARGEHMFPRSAARSDPQINTD